MSERLRRLAQRISDELNDLERVVKRAREGWNRTQQSGLDRYRGFRHIVRNIYRKPKASVSSRSGSMSPKCSS